MRVGIGIVFYNEVRILPRVLDNLKEIDNVIFFDGKYYEFPGKSQLSDDGSRKIIRDYGREIIDVGACSTYDKANVRFQVCGESMDAMVAISCDETIEGNWKDFCLQCDITLPYYKDYTYYIPFHDNDGQYTTKKMDTRLFYKPKEIYQRSAAHWFYYNKNSKLEANHIIDGIKITQDSSYRDKKRESQMNEYQSTHFPLEKKRTELYNELEILKKKKFNS